VALHDFEQAMAYIAERDARVVTRVAERIWERTQQLGEFPGLGRPGRVPDTRELVIPGLPFLIPYRMGHNSVEILRLLHTARQWP
jgi:plasmid stabilization system protein ParE